MANLAVAEDPVAVARRFAYAAVTDLQRTASQMGMSQVHATETEGGDASMRAFGIAFMMNAGRYVIWVEPETPKRAILQAKVEGACIPQLVEVVSWFDEKTVELQSRTSSPEAKGTEFAEIIREELREAFAELGWQENPSGVLAPPAPPGSSKLVTGVAVGVGAVAVAGLGYLAYKKWLAPKTVTVTTWPPTEFQLTATQRAGKTPASVQAGGAALITDVGAANAAVIASVVAITGQVASGQALAVAPTAKVKVGDAVQFNVLDAILAAPSQAALAALMQGATTGGTS